MVTPFLNKKHKNYGEEINIYADGARKGCDVDNLFLITHFSIEWVMHTATVCCTEEEGT